MTSGCVGRLNLSIVNASMCEDAGYQPSTNGVCYNDTTPYAIFNSTLANENNITAIVPTEEYLQYVYNIKLVTAKCILFSGMQNIQYQAYKSHYNDPDLVMTWSPQDKKKHEHKVVRFGWDFSNLHLLSTFQ